ncbi:TetR/AcrR family transcriptional regulator [Leucobacter celer]|uniref:TetR/AcrR family transcriptional regulator n=1 Tax=Leucobacter celer TaxID=668625 RepID=UPI0006A7E7B4|nr:TetR/AcrR family transcriptional regulator [Leucobacter celer]
MARTLEFDREEAVRAARTLFWRAGYDGASIPELERATGLSRSSIYNTFGSKRGLFEAVVQSYLDELVRPRLAPLQADVVAPEALLIYLTGLREAFENLHSMPALCGCLLINTASTPLAQDEYLHDVISGYRKELHSAFVRGLAAMGGGHSDAGMSNADVLTALVVAGFAIARVDPSEAARSVSSAMRLVSDGASGLR